MPRLRPPTDPVTLHFDGAPVVAERGEPAAVALVAAGHLALARSPKFHRPRGPSCLRAACDGCLARVDGEPNVMTCRVPAADGMRIETQNVVGSREHDLLRMADWFFPEGMNHHELFAGVPGVQRVMQAFARRVAGLGKLPKEARASRRAVRREVDALVVGAGASGMAVTVELARRGRAVELVDDALQCGGSVRALGGPEWEPLRASFGRALRGEEGGRVVLRLQTTAAGVYGDDVLVAGEDGIEVVTARTLVLAPGAYDGVMAFEGNDVPGVMSARAGAWLLEQGVVPGGRIVVAVGEGGGPFGEAVARAHPEAVLVRGVPVRVRGSSRIKEATLATAGGERRVACDTLLVDLPRAPAYELCAQAGATLAHEPRGFVVRAKGGRIRDGVFVVGEAGGTPLEPHAVGREGAAAAAAAATAAET
jgi:sarcosine oxidase subunit alpha